MRRLLVGLMMLWLGLPCLALEIPALQGRVSDYADVLTETQRSDLDNRLKAIEGGHPDKPQVAVLLPDSLAGETVEQYANEVFRAWKLGQAGKDNGVLIVLAPTERKIRIEVGYGLEGLLPDSRAKAIIAAMTPFLVRGKEDWAGALGQAATMLAATMLSPMLSGNPDDVPVKTRQFPWLLLLPLYGGVAMLSFLLGRKRRHDESTGNSDPRRLLDAEENAIARARASRARSAFTAPASIRPKTSRTSGFASGLAAGGIIGSSSKSSSSGDSGSSYSGGASSGSSSFSGGGGDSGGGGASGDF